MGDRIGRVYLLVEKLEPVGGVAEQVTLLAGELMRRDIDVWLLARRVLGRDNQYARRLREAGVRLVACPTRMYPLDPRPTWTARSALVRRLSWLTYPLLAPVALLDAGRRRRSLSTSWTGAVGRVRGWLGALILHDQLDDAFQALLDRHAAQQPPDVMDVSGVDCLRAVAWAHRHGHPVVYRQTSLPDPEEPLSERQVADLHRATSVIAVSRAVAGRMRALLHDDRPVWVVPNAVPDLGREADRGNGFHGHAMGRALIVCLCRLSDEKGAQHIPEVANRVLLEAPKARFLVAGDGPLRHRLERRCGELRLGDAVRFLGDLAHEIALELLRRADAMLLPSRREGMPVVAIEAMALAKAMVVTTAGGTPELVEDGVSALLVPPDDVEAMARAVLRVIVDPALRRRLGYAARLAYEHGPYRPQVVADLTLSVYRHSLDAAAAHDATTAHGVASAPESASTTASMAMTGAGLPADERGA